MGKYCLSELYPHADGSLSIYSHFSNGHMVGNQGKLDTASFTSMHTQQCVQMNICEQTLHLTSVRQQKLKLQGEDLL